jgi:hypothetical protein
VLLLNCLSAQEGFPKYNSVKQLDGALATQQLIVQDAVLDFFTETAEILELNNSTSSVSLMRFRDGSWCMITLSMAAIGNFYKQVVCPRHDVRPNRVHFAVTGSGMVRAWSGFVAAPANNHSVSGSCLTVNIRVSFSVTSFMELMIQSSSMSERMLLS